MTVKEVLRTEFIEDLFHLPLSQHAFVEFQQMEIICQNEREKIQEGNSDMWSIFGEKIILLQIMPIIP
jgi:hypothetical protein